MQEKPEGRCDLRWVSPLTGDNYAELRDEAFLDALGVGHLASQLVGGFWPRQGPCWDGLAVLSCPGDPSYRGIVLVEAKSHLDEVYGNGCGAGPGSLEIIRRALQLTRTQLVVSGSPDWEGRLYQSANRLAHLHFFREIAGLPTWLVDIYFLGDPYRSTSRSEWDRFLPSVWSELDVSPESIPGHCTVFMQAFSETPRR